MFGRSNTCQHLPCPRHTHTCYSSTHHFAKHQLVHLAGLAVPHQLGAAQLLHDAHQDCAQLAPNRAQLACRASQGRLETEQAVGEEGRSHTGL